jgi:hypothetical protein
MDTKLTLKLDATVIQAAKAYANEQGRSLSKMVEDYFRQIVSERKSKKQYSPLVEELSGVISDNDLDNLDYVRYLEQKYE